MSAESRAAPMITVAPGGSTRADSLLNRNFALLTQGQLVSQFGNQAFVVGMTFWVSATTHSAATTGLIVLAGMVPLMVLAPFAGAFVDRHSRLGVIIACDLGRGVVVSVLAIAYLTGPASARMGEIFVAALLLGCFAAFFEPAMTSCIPDLVPHSRLEAANGFQQVSSQVAILVGRGFGGALYQALGPIMLFVVDGFTFFFAGASTLLIRQPKAQVLPHEAANTPGTVLAETIAGIRYLLGRSGMFGFLLTASVFNALLTPVSVLLPFYTTDYLVADVRWYGFLLAAISAGSVSGGAAASTVRIKETWRGPVVVGAFISLALLLTILGQVRERWIALALLFMTGLMAGLMNVLILSIIQRSTTAEFRGRVRGVHLTMAYLFAPVGLVGGGALADLTGRNVPLVFGVCGVLAMATVLSLFCRRATRQFLSSL
jgi:DHA3 family macrolide efflux protein-like MFS transporter